MNTLLMVQIKCLLTNSKKFVFRFQCQTVAVADVENSNWKNCSTSIYYLAPSRDGKFYENFVRVFSLRPYRNYKVAVYARNDAFPIILLDTKNKSASSVIFQTDEDGNLLLFITNINFRKVSNFLQYLSKVLIKNQAN